MIDADAIAREVASRIAGWAWKPPGMGWPALVEAVVTASDMQAVALDLGGSWSAFLIASARHYVALNGGDFSCLDRICKGSLHTRSRLLGTPSSP